MRNSFAMLRNFAPKCSVTKDRSRKTATEDIQMSDAPRPCETHPDLIGFKYPLPHLADGLRHQRKIKIVAIGSSSTAGEGSIVPYPCRLELALRKRFPDRMIDVLNRGIGGQEAPSEVSRFESDVLAEAPALVIWQVGTNAVFRKEEFNLDDVAKSIATGLDWLAGLSMDVVLMDLQYTTAVVKPEKIEFAGQMEALISAAAEKATINVFRRFALMRRWYVEDGIQIAELIDPTDLVQLHMSDWATNCVTQALDSAMTGALPATT
jgi:acyl-CoA thioesterase-1